MNLAKYRTKIFLNANFVGENPELYLFSRTCLFPPTALDLIVPALDLIVRCAPGTLRQRYTSVDFTAQNPGKDLL